MARGMGWDGMRSDWMTCLMVGGEGGMGSQGMDWLCGVMRRQCGVVGRN